MAVYVAQNAKPGDPVAFTVSGTGSAPVDNSGAQEADNGTPTGSTNRPGGGLGAPTNTPDPLYKYRWWLMGVVAAALVGGAAFTLSRPAAPQTETAAVGTSRSMLHTLKDELFELETERLEQKISPAEYASTKAALDLLMQRALKRRTCSGTARQQLCLRQPAFLPGHLS